MKQWLGDPDLPEECRAGHTLQNHHEVTVTVTCKGKNCPAEVIHHVFDSADYESALDEVQIELARQEWWIICTLPTELWFTFCKNCAPNVRCLLKYPIDDPRNSF